MFRYLTFSSNTRAVISVLPCLPMIITVDNATTPVWEDETIFRVTALMVQLYASP